MRDFKSIVKQLNGHEVTNPRVLKNLEILGKIVPGVVTIENTHENFTSIKFLNRKGLLKFKKSPNPKELFIYPTLLYYYLTLVLKYDIYKVYSESIKLYDTVGERLNDVKFI